MVPPTPPPLSSPGYFERWAALIAKVVATAASSSSTLSLAPPIPPTTLLATPMSLADNVTNVSPFIPIGLDIAAHNYHRWRQLFDLHLVRYNLRSHVVANSLPRPDDPQWVKDNLVIVLWFYTRITIEMFNVLDHDGATAANIWSSLCQLFQRNNGARKNALHTDFCASWSRPSVTSFAKSKIPLATRSSTTSLSWDSTRISTSRPTSSP
ncbi:hypothetical protein D1007_52003 [Hordeum vulgare]|nr:hypothetical protein D1007_52003 [Hordeum vulgare]